MGICVSVGRRCRSAALMVGLTFGVGAVAAQAASAATLNVNAGCYVISKSLPTMVVTGSGYVPGDFVDITSDVGFVDATTTADPAGNIAVSTPAPLPPKAAVGAQSAVLTADDESINGPITAATAVNVAYLNAGHGATKARPGLGAFREKTSWSFSGFTPGKYIWGHYVIHKRQVARIRFGKATGPCGVLKTRARLFPATPHRRSYPIQVDNAKRYSSHSFPKVNGRLTLKEVLLTHQRLRALTVGLAQKSFRRAAGPGRGV